MLTYRCWRIATKRQTADYVYMQMMRWYEGATSVLVRTVDTDVVVILVGIFSRSCPAPSRNAVIGRLWHRALPLLPHQLTSAKNLGKTKLPHFPIWERQSSRISFIFTPSLVPIPHPGSTVKSKKSAWVAWKTYPVATAGFNRATQDGFT